MHPLICRLVWAFVMCIYARVPFDHAIQILMKGNNPTIVSTIIKVSAMHYKHRTALGEKLTKCILPHERGLQGIHGQRRPRSACTFSDLITDGSFHVCQQFQYPVIWHTGRAGPYQTLDVQTNLKVFLHGANHVITSKPKTIISACLFL